MEAVSDLIAELLRVMQSGEGVWLMLVRNGGVGGKVVAVSQETVRVEQPYMRPEQEAPIVHLVPLDAILAIRTGGMF